MNTQIRVVKVYADYVLANDMSRAIITFRFPSLSDGSRVTLLHDRFDIQAEAYTLDKKQSIIVLSAEPGESVVINIWSGAQLLASGVYIIDVQGSENVLRAICDSGMSLEQSGILKSDLECGLVDGGIRYAGD